MGQKGMDMDDDEKRVRRGIELLNRVCPKWALKIDLNTLNINDCGKCVLGQVFGDYLNGRRAVFDTSPVKYEVALDHGFTHDYRNADNVGELNLMAQRLTDEWKRQITAL